MVYLAVHADKHNREISLLTEEQFNCALNKHDELGSHSHRIFTMWRGDKVCATAVQSKETVQ